MHAETAPPRDVACMRRGASTCGWCPRHHDTHRDLLADLSLKRGSTGKLSCCSISLKNAVPPLVLLEPHCLSPRRETDIGRDRDTAVGSDSEMDKRSGPSGFLVYEDFHMYT